MIVWSGRGFLSIIVLLVTLFICVSIISTENADYGFIITAFVTGIFSWYFGKKWNTQNERIVIDEKTGQRLKIKNNHTLFWIPMQYWGIIFSAFGIIILFQNSVLFGILCSLILIALIVIPLVNQKSRIKSKQTIDANKQILEADKEIINKQLRKEKEDPNRFMPQ